MSPCVFFIKSVGSVCWFVLYWLIVCIELIEQTWLRYCSNLFPNKVCGLKYWAQSVPNQSLHLLFITVLKSSTVYLLLSFALISLLVDSELYLYLLPVLEFKKSIISFI